MATATQATEQLAMFGGGQRDGLRGEVISVRFRNDDNGYTVADIETEDGQLETIVGAMPAEAASGVTITVHGEWTTHARYGRQFSVQTVDIERPATVDGITAYLGSGLIPGIGPVSAEAIARHFGTEALDILDAEPERVLEVSGIGKKRAAQIAGAWADHKAARDLVMLLGSHGVTTGLAMRIYGEYGAMAMEIVTQDPYRLVWDMDRVGFKTADGLAQKLGVPRDDPDRISAALAYVSSEQTARAGHCYVDRDTLTTEAQALLGVPIEQVTAALEATLANGRLIEDLGGIYGRSIWNAEKLTADRIYQLLSAEEDHCLISADDAALSETIRAAMDIELTPAQLAAVLAGLRERLSVITGGPGTGKTTIIKALLAAKPDNVAVALMAPTGRAAKRMTEATGYPAATIHRGCGYNPELGWTINRDSPLDADLVIVDEVSMLDIGVARHLLDAIPDGAHVVLVGDIDQLPSVGPGNVLRDIIASGAVHTTRLNVIHRQAEDSTIITTSHAVNRGEAPIFALKPGDGDVFFFSADSQEETRDIVLDLVTRRIPQVFGVPAGDVQVLGPMKRGAAGVLELNQRLQALLNPHGDELQIGQTLWRVGDRVMQRRNNYDAGVFNGDLGAVASIERTDDGKLLWVSFEDQLVSYEPKDVSENLLHAYAMTIHKSQGSEFPVVVIPLLTAHYVMLQRNLLYTAMTRARQLVVIVGQRRAIHIAVGNATVAARNTALCERVQALVQGQRQREG